MPGADSAQFGRPRLRVAAKELPRPRVCTGSKFWILGNIGFHDLFEQAMRRNFRAKSVVNQLLLLAGPKPSCGLDTNVLIYRNRKVSNATTLTPKHKS